jgi:MoaA/NifB/PqqE/SkfB family radical SAM enzyme
MNYSKIFDNIRNFYSYFNYFSKYGKAILPLRYFFELTHKCNLSCPYCYVEKSEIKEELSTLEWKNIIKQIPFYSFITLVGGEVLIRPDFSEILFECCKKTLSKVNVVTNGILMNEKIIDDFIKSKMLLVSVSLDGWGENHDKNRNKTGIFEKISENLLILNKKRKNKRLMVDIKTIVLKDNLEDLLKLYEYCTKMNFEFFSVSFLRNNNLKQNSKLHNAFDEVFYVPDYPIEDYFDMDKFKKIYLEIQKIKKHSKTKIRFSPKFDNENPEIELKLIENFFKNSFDKKPTEIYKPCLYPYSNTIINPRGDVYPCLAVKMGNLKEQKLIEIINNPCYKCFRKNLRYSKVFNSCQLCCEAQVKLGL